MAKTLLVIDDSSTIREAVRFALTGEEWEAVTATNGKEAAAALEQHRVDAILCDVTPGEEDGYELCRSLGSSAAGTGIPILLMGGSVNATAALAVGASSTLPKPFAAAQLVQALSETLDQGDFSFDFDDVPAALAQGASGEPEAAAEEFELESTAYADDDLEIDEIEVIDLSEEGEFDDLELLDDLPPVELTPVQEESEAPSFAIEPELAAGQDLQETVSDAEGPGFGELLEPTVGDFAEETELAEDETTPPDDGMDWGLEEIESPALSIEPEVAAAATQEERVMDAEGLGFGELLEPTVGDFPDELELEAPAAPRFDDGLDLGLGEMDGSPRSPAEPVDLSDLLGEREAAPPSRDEDRDKEEFGVVPEQSAEESGEVEGGFELPVATRDEIDVSPGEPESADDVAAAFEFDERKISLDAFDADLLPEADTIAEPRAEPAQEPEEEAVQDTALEIDSLREVESLDIGLDALEEGPEQEPSAPTDEPAFPSQEEQAPTVAPEPQEDWAASESMDEDWQVSIDEAPPAPAWEEETEDAEADLLELEVSAEEGRSEAEPGAVETVAPGWSDLKLGSVPRQESPEPAPEEPVAEHREDLTAEIAATAGRAVREALERSLCAEQLAPVIAAAVERVAWEVVPQLAERLIRETIEKLQQDPPTA